MTAGAEQPVHVSQRVRDERAAAQHEVRAHLAWLMWCWQQGYVKAEDRAIMTNWLLDDPATLHPDDAVLRPHLLAMADEVLAAMRGRK